MTPLIRKIAGWVLTAAALMAIGSALTFRYTSKELAALDQRVQAAEKVVSAYKAAASTKQAHVAEIEKADAHKNKEVQNALKENPDWSSERVPDAVFDSLFDTADVARPVPE